MKTRVTHSKLTSAIVVFLVGLCGYGSPERFEYSLTALDSFSCLSLCIGIA